MYHHGSAGASIGISAGTSEDSPDDSLIRSLAVVASGVPDAMIGILLKK